MEKAILKTLAYGDIFDYPMKAYEIHKWLIGRKASLRQVEKALEKLREKGKAVRVKNYYFLSRKDGFVGKRILRKKQSAWYFKKAQFMAQILKLIPWIRLVGISGGLAMENAKKSDDIDLFLVTAKNRLWISRILALGLLSLTGQRRKVTDKGRKVAGKLCLNILLEEDRLEQRNRDIYLAHEVLQMKPLWQKDNVYGKYLEDNQWAFKFLPNWTTSLRAPKGRGNLKLDKIASSLSLLAMTMEQLAKWLQLRIMGNPKGMERIEDGALYFHPNDIRPKVLAALDKKCQFLVYSEPSSAPFNFYGKTKK